MEEAAGLGRFKRRRHRAELKLARVATQVERARDVEAEVRKRLRPLALQATAAERAEKLGEEIAGLNAAIATLDLARLAERREASEARRTSELARRTELEASIAALIAARERAEEELTDAAGTREGATAALYRLRSATERLELRREAAQTLHASVAAEHRAAVEFDPARSDELVDAARAATAAAQEAARERARLEFEVEELWARVAGAERARLARARRASWRSSCVRAARSKATWRAAARTRCSPCAIARTPRACGRSPCSGCATSCAASSTKREGASRRADAGRARPAADEADEAARTAARERDDLVARAQRWRRSGWRRSSSRSPSAKAAACRARARRAGRAARASTLDVEPGDERAVAAALGRLASAIVADDPERGLALLEKHASSASARSSCSSAAMPASSWPRCRSSSPTLCSPRRSPR